jgi:hypothetical protein
MRTVNKSAQPCATPLPVLQGRGPVSFKLHCLDQVQFLGPRPLGDSERHRTQICSDPFKLIRLTDEAAP